LQLPHLALLPLALAPDIQNLVQLVALDHLVRGVADFQNGCSVDYQYLPTMFYVFNISMTKVLWCRSGLGRTMVVKYLAAGLTFSLLATMSPTLSSNINQSVNLDSRANFAHQH